MSRHDQLVYIVESEISFLRMREDGGKARFRMMLEALLDPTRKEGIEELVDRRFDAARQAATVLEGSALYPWVLLPVAALGFQAVHNGALLYWAATEMGLEDEDKRQHAKDRVNRMIDSAVWAYRLMIGLRDDA